MILESVEHGPLIWPTIEENGVIRTKKYAELSGAEKIQADYDMKATNIILQGLHTDIYSLERECKLYDAFDKFTHIKGESLHTYYLRFTQLINDMNIYKMKMEQFQVNTKFLSSLSPEYSKLVTDVKLVKDFHTSNFDQLYAYLEKHELHANEVCLMSPFVDSGFTVHVFSPRDDSISFLNKAMPFQTAVASSRFPSSDNQLRTSSNIRNHATIQDGRVTVQQVQGRQGQNYSGTTYKVNAASLMGNTTNGQARIIKCYNCQGEGHMARQCTQLKRPRNATWFKEKAMLAEAQEAGQILDEEQLAFLANPGIQSNQAQTIIPHNPAFQTKDLNTYDSNCDDLSTAQAVLMANISNYGCYLRGYQNSFYLKKAQWIKPTLYDGTVISEKQVVMPVIDNEETLILEEESRSKMSKNEKDPEAIKQNISHKPIDYEKLNRLTEDFGKRFTPQQELSTKQAFWLRISNPTIESSSTPPVKVEKRTTPNALVEGEWGFEHTKAVFNNEIIPFLKSLKNIFNVFDKDLLNEITEVQTFFNQMEAIVQQSSVEKQCLEIANKEIIFENDRLSIQIMSQEIVSTNNKEEIVDHDRCDLANINVELENSVAKLLSKNECLCKEINHVKQVFKDQFDSIKQTCILQKEQSDSLINKLNLKYAENKDLKAQIQDKVFVIASLKNDLRKLKEKTIVDNAAQIPSTTTVALGMFKLDLEPLAPMLVHNREIHINYLKHTQEQADIL
nr:hypothetical protein [Tanacetum cinerariifolium]